MFKWSQKTVDRWFEDDGNTQHRLGHDLAKGSIIFELGGHVGDGTQRMFDKYNCTIYAFEPVLEFYNQLSDRFADVPNVHCKSFGLGSSDQTLKMEVKADGSSLRSHNGVPVLIKEMKQFLKDENLTRVDLIDINIEGAEYDLLEYMLDERLVSVFDNIQIQFHDFFKGAGDRMKDIQQRLSETHELTYQYIFCYENWKRKA